MRTAGDRPEGGRGSTEVRAVYVHAPFCARRCGYCDFAVSVRRTGDLDAWIDAVSGEVALVEGEGLFALAPRLASLYVGGGTPSLLGPAAMAELAARLGPERISHPDVEWTAEANPESFAPELARAWRGAGVNRLSLGVQSFDERVLRWMGRLHGARGALDAVRTARAAGFDDVSVDLIFGLPAHLGRSWVEDLERVLDLDVPHVSLYGLTVEPATPLGRAVREGREPQVDEARYEEEFLMAAEVLSRAGYEHYEVSNFARPGARSRHNATYWRGEPYLGLGNGAHSYAHPVRRWNERAWEQYRAAVVEGRSPEAGREVLDAAARRLERIWLGLRTDAGVAVEGLGGRAVEAAEAWVRAGWATLAEGVVRLTARGWLRLDRLAVELDDAAGSL